MNIVSFSGGKDSTALLLMMLESVMRVDRVVCVDTTKEFPAMYRHIERVRMMIYPIKIEIVELPFDYWFGEHVKTKGKHKGKVGYGFPDVRNRWCTGMKQRLFRRHVSLNTCTRPADVTEFHGIAFDERERTNKNKYLNRSVKYPLVEWGITEPQALQYCYSKGLDWEGLYEKFHRVSCWCCPLSRISELRVLYTEYPDLWQQLIEMDKKSFRKFRSDYSVDELTKRFSNEKCSLFIPTK